MSDLLAKLRLEGDARGAVAAADQAAQSVGRFAGQADAAGSAAGQLSRELSGVASSATIAASQAKEAAQSYQTFYGALHYDFATEFTRQQGLVSQAHVRGAAGAKLQAYELVNLGRNFADVGVQAAMLQNPLLILIQQGPQIADVFSTAAARGVTFKAALAGIVEEFAPLAAGAGLIAALVAPLALAITSAHAYGKATKEAQAATMGLGAAAGLTADDLMGLAEGAAQSGEVTRSEARKGAEAYVAAGITSRDVITGLIGLQRQYALATGQDAASANAELAKSFAHLATGVGTLDGRLNFLDATTRDNILTLAKQTDQTYAQQAALAALQGDLDKTTDALYRQKGGWDGIKRAAMDFFDQVGQDLNPGLQKRIDNLKFMIDSPVTRPSDVPYLKERLKQLEGQQAIDRQIMQGVAAKKADNDATKAAIDNYRALTPLQSQRADIEERLAKARKDAVPKAQGGPGLLTPQQLAQAEAAAKVQLAQLDRRAAGPRDNSGLRADQTINDLAAEKQAMLDYIAAVQKGPDAINEWKVAEAGRQAVVRLGLDERQKVSDAIKDRIRQEAEDAERTKQQAARMEAGATLQRSAELDTAALKQQAEAAAGGEAAIEALRIKQAGLAAQQQLGIVSLDKLTGADLEQAKAAIAAAEGKEAQAIATDKAIKVAATVGSLDRQIQSQEDYQKALAGGAKALVDYTVAEAVRQEVERTGHTLSQEQIDDIRRRTESLLRLTAANAMAADQRQFEQDLRLATLTADEREREVRALQLRDQLMRKDATLSEADAIAKARLQAAQDQAAMRRAQDIGKLKDDLEQAYIESGQVSFDKLEDYLYRRLHEAIYKAFYGKPIDLIVNASVNWINAGLDKVFGQVLGQFTGSPFTGGSAGGGTGKLADATNSLTSSSTALSSASSSLAQIVPVASAAMIAINALTPVLSNALGFDARQAKAAQLGGNLGGLVGSVIFGALVGKESNHGATATFANGWFDLSGNKRTGKTSDAVTDAASSILDLMKRLRSIGVSADGILKSVELGGRDPSKITLADGTILHAKAGDVQALVDAAAKALLAHGAYDDPNMKKVVDQMIAANRSFEDIANTLSDYVDAQTFGSDIKLALLKFTDPKAAAVKELQNQQKARRDQLADYAAQGFYTDSQLAELQATLNALESAELADTLAKLGDAASDAAKALRDAKPSLREWLDQLTQTAAAPVNPFEQRGLAMAQYERVLEQARAGDSNALSNLTGYAERLLEADRNATSDAQARLALYNKVTGDIGQLAAPDTAVTQAAAIEALTAANNAVTLQASQQVVAAISGSDGVVTAIEQIGAQITAGLAKVEAALGGGLDNVGEATGEGLGSLLEAVRQQGEKLDALATAQRSANAFFQVAAARP